jgi:glycosyltransferase involved in cell wall biosynthesis
MSGSAMAKPVLFVTGHAPFDRAGAFARLHEREDVEFALFGGRSRHGGHQLSGDLPFPHRRVHQREVAALAASGRYRAVVCSTGGRVALPGAWLGARPPLSWLGARPPRRGRVPLVLWTSLWAHPRSVAHAFSYPALRRLYRSADAVVTYGPHVGAYVAARGARNVYVAAQSVDNDFWGSPDVGPPPWDGDPAGLSSSPPGAGVKFLFAGRPAREKGVGVLIEAWSASGLGAPSAALVLVGVGPCPPWVPADGAVRDVACLDPVGPTGLRDIYAAADALVVPSIATRTFREPWGLVINEAMNRHLPVIASDAVGAVAGGLVRDGHNGLVVPAGNAAALAHALRRLAADPALRSRLGAAGARDVAAYSHDAWAEGFSRALASLGLSRAAPGPGPSQRPAGPGPSPAPPGPVPSRAPADVDVSRERW